MNARQAYRKWKKTIDRIDALYKEKRDIEREVVAQLAPRKQGDIFKLRDESTNRLTYWRITELFARFDDARCVAKVGIRAARCTKSGSNRSLGQRFTEETMERAVFISTNGCK